MYVNNININSKPTQVIVKDMVVDNVSFINFFDDIDNLTIINTKIKGDIDFSTTTKKKIKSTTLERCIFYGQAKFNNRNFMTTTKFINCDFHIAPEFHNCKLHQSTYFVDCKFLDTESEEAAFSYRVLKRLMEDLKSRHDEMVFAALEMQSIVKRADTPPSIKFASWFYLFTSNYGQSISLPVFWLLIINTWFGVFYFEFGRDCDRYSLNDVEIIMSSQISQPLSAMNIDYLEKLSKKKCVIETGGHSCGNTASEGKSSKSKRYIPECHPAIASPLALKIVSFFHTVFNLGLFTLLILAIRRRFKID